ncbi:MAG: VCBS repeat-containing protein, partial [Planctomycetes bacterium]|nr:VCBS repeat-containing protein [Planctomycetota bacterium]
ELSDRFEPHVSLLRDVDHDGDLDIITMDGETLVMVITNDGGGGFAEGTRYELDGAAEIITMVSVDFDGDGSFDVAANDEITDNLVILLNQGDGTFVQSEEVYPVGEQPAFLVAGDIDGDDHQDLVSVSRADDTIGIFFNLGDATFAPEVAIEVGNYPVGAALGDFDGDDDIDIAVVSSFSSTLSVLFNEGYGTFEDPIDLDIETPRYVMAADIDADLDLDLVVAFESESSLGVFLNDGQGRFDPQEPIGLGRRPRSVIACELNRDGFPDLVAADELDASVSILLSVEPGVFAPSLTYRVGQNPRYAIAGDIDGDGDSDLLSANHSSYDFTLFLNETTAPEPPPAYLEGICTELDYHRVSLPTGLDIGVDRETRFLLPVADAPLPALVENISQHASQREFLTATFPEAFPSLTQEEYNLLVARRASRQYYAGQLYRLRSRYGHAYGFDVLVDSGSDIGELLTEEESRTIYEALSGVFTLEPLVYHPRSPDARQVAAAWTAQDVPVWMDLFRRGDVTADGAVDLSDVISLLDHEFRGGAVPSCQDTADVNDDGELDISDAINILRHLFLGVSAVQDPLESCGWDRTADGLSCLEYRACVQ